MTLRPSLHPHRTSWARKQPPSLLIPVFCAMILQGVGGTLPFYITGKEFQAIPQRGQDSWPPEVQLWGKSHSLCSQNQRHPWSSWAVESHLLWLLSSTGSEDLDVQPAVASAAVFSPPRVKMRGPSPRKPLKEARNIPLELKARTKEVQPASHFHLHS